MREKIFQQLTHFYAVCDYPDEDLDPFVSEEARKVLEECTAELDKLYQGFQRGRVLKEGLPVTILGRPNVGKSSLLNSLAGYERAIVTDEAGTTRDVVTESVRCGDTVLRCPIQPDCGRPPARRKRWALTSPGERPGKPRGALRL